MNSRHLITGIITGLFTSSVFAASDNIDLSLSVKTWNANVEASVGSGSSGSSTKGNSPIIGVTARKGDYFVSASTLLETPYTFQSGGPNAGTIARKDYDFSLGYRATENISVIGGYKALSMTDRTISNYIEEHNGIYVGLAGFKLLNNTDFIYGNYWVAPSMTSSGTAVVDKYDSFKVSNYEIGLGRALTSSTQITLGFRNQEMKANNLTQKRAETFIMKGFLLGLNVNF